MSLEFKEDAVCEGCGQFGAYAFDGGQFCGGCYEAQGSCCPGFGAEPRENSLAPPCLTSASEI
jgi:hypothetical protein